MKRKGNMLEESDSIIEVPIKMKVNFKKPSTSEIQMLLKYAPEKAFEIFKNNKLPFHIRKLFSCKQLNENFDIWYVKDKKNLNDISFYDLCSKFNEHFNKWFDINIYDYDFYSTSLALYCSEHFNLWWDPDKFNWEEGSGCLAKCCFRYFDMWWDPERFNWNDVDYLKLHCSKYKSIWYDDYLLRKIT